MTWAMRIIVVIGLALVLAVGTFPPRKELVPPNPNPGITGIISYPLTPRFVFSDELYIGHGNELGQGRGLKPGYYLQAEIDIGKMLAEWVIIISATGMVLVVVGNVKK